MARVNLRSRAVTWLLVVAYALVVSGVPLPMAAPEPPAGSPAAVRLAAKDRSTPFPCMDKPCGCATAEQCRNNCCCAKPRRTVRPTASASDVCHSYRGLAAPPAARSATPASDEGSHESSSVRFVSMKALLACGGILEGWSAATTSLPPPAAVSSDIHNRLIGEVLLIDAIGLSADRSLDPPPPRA